ncbi:MAG: carboxypeptidase-like regulatory domain-containing protein, partial [Cyclobacteriaceae bacterium]
MISSFGQERKYTFSFDSISLSSALNQIEIESDLAFFYKLEWIESITLNKNFNQTNLDDLLNELLTKKGINYITNGKRIILTGKVNIISTLVFDSSKAPYQVGYVFEREFSASGDNVLEVGDRSKVINGSKAILAGYIKNLELGEPIPGAIVFSETAEVSTLTDSKGFFSMVLPSGAHTLLIQFSGMKTKRQEIVLFSDGSLSLELEEEPRLLEEVTIVSDGNANVNNVRMGTASINLEEVKNVPKFMGENDMIQA